MPAPSNLSTFQRPDLGLNFEEFDLLAAKEGYIASQVLPMMDVGLQTSGFSRIPIGELLRDVDLKRASGSGYQRDDFVFERDNYATEERGAEELIDDRERKIYAYTVDAERIASDRAMIKVLRDYEREVANAVFNTTTWTGSALTTAVGTAWSTFASADPVADVHAALSKVRDSSGIIPNTMIIDWDVWRVLQSVDSIIDRVKHSGYDDPKQFSPATLATLFGVDEVLVAGGIRNTAAQGAAASLSKIWNPNYAMLCKVARSEDLKEVCVGRTFHWAEDGSSDTVSMEQYREEKRRSDVLRGRMEYHAKILYPQTAHLLTGVNP